MVALSEKYLQNKVKKCSFSLSVNDKGH